MSENHNEIFQAKIGLIAAALTVLGDFLAFILAIIELKEVLKPDKTSPPDADK